VPITTPQPAARLVQVLGRAEVQHGDEVVGALGLDQETPLGVAHDLAAALRAAAAGCCRA
jgi:hypothetical protein